MTDTSLRRLAWTLWAAAMFLSVGAIALTLGAIDPGDVFDGDEIISAFVTFGYASVAVIVIHRLPRHPFPWVIALGMLCGTVYSFAVGYATTTYLGRLTLPGGSVALWVAEWISVPASTIPFIFVPLLFPTGRALTARWRPLVTTAWVAMAATMIGLALLDAPLTTHSRVAHAVEAVPNPVGVLQPSILFGPGEFDDIIDWVYMVIFLGALASLALRFVRSRGEERQQLKWLVYGAAPLLTAPFIGAASAQGPAFQVGFFLLLLIPGVAMGIALLRYRLYDIDRIISRTVSYAMVTVVVGGITVVVALVPSLVVGSGGTEDWTVAAATVLAVALFRPVRGRIQERVDRRFNRRRYDATRAADAFAARLRHQVDLVAVQRDLTDVVEDTLQPSRIDLVVLGS